MSRQPPFFSIVIPTHNRPVALAACLASLLRLDYPRDRFEVIVVDDESGISPTGIVESVLDRLDVVLIRQAHAGPATARNLGVARARGDLLAFIDDDCTPAPDWLSTLAARFDTTSGPIMVGGRAVNRLAANPYSTASQLLVDYLYTSLEGRRGWFFTSNNFAVPAATFRALGGFDEAIPRAAAEDREFCCRWAHQNHPMLFAPEVVVEHAHALDLPRFWRQHYNYGRGACAFRRLLRRGGVGHFPLEALAFYARLIRYPLTRGIGWRSARLCLLLSVSQFAQVAGFVVEQAVLIRAALVRQRRMHRLHFPIKTSMCFSTSFVRSKRARSGGSSRSSGAPCRACSDVNSTISRASRS